MADLDSELLELDAVRAQARARIAALVSPDGNIGDFTAADPLTVPETLPQLSELLARPFGFAATSPRLTNSNDAWRWSGRPRGACVTRSRC